MLHLATTPSDATKNYAPDYSPRLDFAGDCALILDFSAAPGSPLADAALARVLALDRALTQSPPPGFIEAIPAYSTLLVAFDAASVEAPAFAAAVLSLIGPAERLACRRRRWRIPVAYGGAFGEDLDEIAARLAVSPAEVIAAHAAGRYTVAMLGFLPGFAYLSGLAEWLAVPRRSTPRPRVAAGGIAIGGAQTAIGSVAGPSGWNQIGRTPARAFALDREPVVFIAPGDEIEFEPIDAAVFAHLDALAGQGDIVAERLS